MSDTKTESGLIKWSSFLARIGVSLVTGTRWRQSGKLVPTVNIDGKLYITAEDVQEFERRAKAGDFAKRLQKPTPRNHEKTKTPTRCITSKNRTEVG